MGNKFNRTQYILGKNITSWLFLNLDVFSIFLRFFQVITDFFENGQFARFSWFCGNLVKNTYTQEEVAFKLTHSKSTYARRRRGYPIKRTGGKGAFQITY